MTTAKVTGNCIDKMQHYKGGHCITQRALRLSRRHYRLPIVGRCRARSIRVIDTANFIENITEGGYQQGRLAHHTSIKTNCISRPEKIIQITGPVSDCSTGSGFIDTYPLSSSISLVSCLVTPRHLILHSCCRKDESRLCLCHGRQRAPAGQPSPLPTSNPRGHV